jgi:hypothetical protein
MLEFAVICPRLRADITTYSVFIPLDIHFFLQAVHYQKKRKG